MNYSEKGDENMNHVAVLSNDRDIVKFTCGDIVIRYKGPYSLEYFSKINKYDNGYIEVMCKFTHAPQPIEDYIDLEEIAEELYMDPAFLREVKEVRCEHV